jgi:hypothetical protein
MKTTALLIATLVSTSMACSRRSSPPPIVAEPASSAVSGAAPSAAAEQQDAPERASDAGTGWLARRVDAAGLDLGTFAVASPPDAAHPRGVIAALGYVPGAVSAVTIDVATARELGRLKLGPSDPEWATEIAATQQGVVVAIQTKAALDLVWLDRGATVASRRAFRGLGADAGYDLRGFAVFDDRIVLASGGNSSVELRILDAQGNLLSTHTCHGGLFRPGRADLVRMGDQVVLANMLSEREMLPLCAGHLHGAVRWHDATIRHGDIRFRDDGIAVAIEYGPERRLDDALRPTGPALPPEAVPDRPGCDGLTGTAPWQGDIVGGVDVVYMVSCCGDPSPGGLFICLPR